MSHDWADRRAPTRRELLAGGAAAAGAMWVAPSITTFDRVDAAVGSCGVKPRQMDFSRFSGSLLPSSFASDDGSVTIGFSLSDPFGVIDSWWQGRAYTASINGVDHPVITGMTNATFGMGVTMTFTFSVPVRPSFFLVDVDRGSGWVDTVTVTGSLSGSTVMPASMSLGGTQSFTPPNIVTGTASSSSATGNVEVDFDSLVDTITIAHTDPTSRTGFQWIGVHDFHWC